MKRINELLDFIGANKKKELIKVLAINIGVIAATIVATIFLKQIMIAFAGIIALIITNYLISSIILRLFPSSIKSTFRTLCPKR